MTTPKDMLAKLARQSAAALHAMAHEAFRGEASIETANTVYRFRDGVFVACARKPARAFEAPSAMQDLRLIGFLSYDRGLWSLSPRWREGAIAVFWRTSGIDERAFVLTSPTVAFALEAPPREPASRGSISGVMRRPDSLPPPLRRPAPPSMTRVLTASAPAADLR